jgi:hypothetical protein
VRGRERGKIEKRGKERGKKEATLFSITIHAFPSGSWIYRTNHISIPYFIYLAKPFVDITNQIKFSIFVKLLGRLQFLRNFLLLMQLAANRNAKITNSEGELLFLINFVL